MTTYNKFDQTSKQDLLTLHKALRTVTLHTLTLEQAKVFYERGSYLPSFEKGDIVRCEFIGIGSEFDDTHYAVVWKAPSNSESITVIPMTSSILDNTQCEFCIGKIENFMTIKGSTEIKPSYVYVNKITEISRRRVTPWTYTNCVGNSEIVKLSHDQINRISDAFMVYYLDYNYLFNEIVSNGLQFPIEYPEYILSYGYRPITNYILDRSDRKQFIGKFILHNGNVGQVKMFYINDTSSAKELCELIRYDRRVGVFRKRVLKSLFSGNEKKVLEAKAIISQLYLKFLS